jgi:amino acid transporter
LDDRKNAGDTTFGDEAAAAGEVATRADADGELRREIGPWGLAANAINGAVGGGIFVLPGLVAAILGPAALVAYLICGVAIALVLTCFAELGSAIQRSGGCVAYIDEAFGPLAGFLAWVTYSLGYEVVASAALGALLVDSVATVVPALAHGPLRVCALIAAFGFLAGVNILGVKESIRMIGVVTVAKLLPLFFILVAGVFFVHGGNFHWTVTPTFAQLRDGAFLIFFAFQGLEEALNPSAEIRNPRRTVPLAIFYATAGLIFLYTALQLVAQGVLGAELGRSLVAPLADVGAKIAGSSGRRLLLAGASISLFSSMMTSMMCTPRTFFRMAQDGMLPAALTRVHRRFRTPHISILVAAGLMIAFSVTQAFQHLAVLSVASTLLVYLAICLGALRLRYTRSAAGFRAPGGPIAGILGAAVVLLLLASTEWRDLALMGGTLLAATGYFFAAKWLRGGLRGSSSR